MNLKRAISAVCAAAVLVSTSLSELPAQFSAYSHAYAALTAFQYTFDQSPVAMAVQSADDGSLKCEVVTRFPVDGVTNGVTTVGELRRLYSGLAVSGFEFRNSSLEGLTAEDIHTSISVLSGTDSGSYDGWYAVTDEDTLEFADMSADNDSKVVQSLSFHIYIDGGAVSRLGMKPGDRIYLNSDGSGYSYYTHTEPGGPITMTITKATWENESGMSCAYNSDFEIPGVTKGVTTFGELKALYDGIKVEGYEFRDSTVEGMTADDLVPTIVLMTGSDWNWKAVYNTTEMNFSSDLADVADDEIVQSIAFSISVQDGSFAKLGLKTGDSFVVNPDGRELDYYEYTMRGGPLRAEVEEIQNEEGTSLVCTFTTYLSLPGVTIGETTAGQLKNLYRGVRVGVFELRESTVEGLTADDLVPTVAIMTGDNWVWNASYCSNEMTFSDALKDVHDSDVVKELSFRMTISGDSVERLGLKAGDVVVINQNDIRIFLVDDMILWDAVDGADHYEIFCGDSLLDNCIANNSMGFRLAMSLNGYKPGRYQLDVYAVYADGTRKLLGSVDYDYGTAVSGENTFTYSENGDGTVTITGGSIVTPKLEIPAELDGKKVSAIGVNAFTGNDVITDLVIPEGVTALNWYSFNTCGNLETVTLPDSLQYIDGWAFERCGKLKTVNIPAGVLEISGGAFAQNGSMTSITCDPANKNYVSVDGVLFTKDMKELVAYPGGIQGGYTVPAAVNHIGDAAFYGALGLDSVTILGNLDFIGFEAFAECDKLTDVAIRDGVNYVGYWAFRGCDGIKSLTVPQSVTNIGDQAFGFAYADHKLSGFSLRGYKDSAVNFYAIRHDIPFVCIGEASEDNKPFDRYNAKESEVETDPDIPEDEKITTIVATPAFNMKDKSEAGVGLDLSKVKVKAREIYDEEGIKRAEEALGTEISANKKYNLLDLTLINGDEDYSNSYDGLVEVVIPIPKGHRDKTFYCYRLLDDGTKELIPGKQREDSYVVYLEHFSVYAFVADEEHTCVFSESWTNDKSGHWHECACGKTTGAEPHTAGDWVTDIEPTDSEDGHRYKACTVCGYVMEEETLRHEQPEKTAAPVISPNGGTFTGTQAAFVVDSVKSWVIDGSQIKNAASADLTLIPTLKLRTGGLAGTEGIQFTVTNMDIPAGIAVSFRVDFAGRFANLYKSVDGRFVFMGCAKLDSTGKVTVPGVDGRGDYAVMLCEFSALPGDVNNDGILNALDASEILKYAVGMSSSANLAAADLNGDGTVNASDAAEVLKKSVVS